MKQFIQIINQKYLVSCLLLVFFSNTYGQYQINGSASQDDCNCYTLTPAANTQVGSVWNTNQIDLNNSFDFVFEVFLGCSDGGADGMAFGLQALNTSVGINGNGMGLGTISPSLGVYLDTYQNSSPDSDPWQDHIAIASNGNVDHLSANNLAGPVDISASATNIEDCAWHTLRIVWTYNSTVSQTLDVYFDGVLRLSYTGDVINGIFGGAPNVFWGFTGSTGGLNNEHKFCTALSANFVDNITDQFACAGSLITFTDSSTTFGAISDWQWDFGDGSPTVNGTNTTSHTYTTDGNYNAELVITDNSGCKDSIEIPITIASPQVTASSNIYSICQGDQAQLDAVITSTPQNCQLNQAVSGNDDDPTSNLINSFPCVPAGATITSINIDASIGNNCPNWYYFDIYINGTLAFDNQCNQTGLNISAFLPITSIELISEDNPADGIGDFVNLDLTVNITYVTNPTYNYIWTPNFGTLNDSLLYNPLATPNSSTTYTVLVTDPLNPSCQATDTVNINVNQPPTINNLNTVCNLSNYNVSFDVSGGNGGPYNVIEISPGGVGGSFTGNTWTSNNIPSGTYYEFNIDDGNNCGPIVISGTKNCGCETFAGSMNLTAIDLCQGDIALAIHNNDSTLDNDDNFIFILHDSSGTSLGNIISTNTNPSFSFNPPMQYGTTYYISAVAGNDALVGGIDYNDTCLSVSLGTPVTWHAIPTAIDQNPSAYCEDALGSGSVSNIDLTQWNSSIDGGQSNTIFWFSDATLTTPVPSSNNVTITNNQQFYAFVDNGFCNDTAIVTFTVLGLPIAIDQTPLSFCEDIAGNGSVNGIDLTSFNSAIDGGLNNNVSWFLDSTLTTPIASPTNITITNNQQFYALIDNSVCTNKASITFTVDSLPNANAGIDDTICSSLSYNLNAISSVGIGIWSGGPIGTIFLPNNLSPNPIVTVPTAGTYTFTWIENNNNCNDTDYVDITFSNLSVSADSTQADCGQANGSITIFASDGNSPYQYSIDGGITYQNSNIFNNLASNTYNISVKDASNCIFSNTENVTNSTLFTANIVAVSNVSCNGYVDGNAEVNGSDPSLTYSYSWSNMPIQNTSIVNNLDTGTYFCLVTDVATGCFDTAFINITQPDSVNLQLTATTPDTICVNGSSSIQVNASGGSGNGYIYSWFGPNINTSTAFDSLIVSPTSNSNYTINVVDNNGCPSNTVNANIYIFSPLNIIATASDTSICPGENITLNALGPFGGNGGPYSFNWNNGLGNNQTLLTSPNTSSYYTVTINDGCSPIAKDSIQIIVNPSPVVSFYGDNLSGCESLEGFPVNFTNTTSPSEIDSAYWIFSNLFSTDTNYYNIDSVRYLTEGNYDVSLIVTSPNGCIGRADSLSYITVNGLPIVDFEINPNPVSMFNPTVEFTDQSYNNIQSWEWNFDGLGYGDGYNTSFTFPSDTGNYWVTLTVTDQNNCVDSLQKLVIVKGEYTMYVPNAFTPNGDRNNEVFAPKGDGILEMGYSFSIYDRWGEKLFESNNLYEGWDGSFKGSLVPTGVYVWKLVYYDTDDIRHFEIGSVTIHY